MIEERKRKIMELFKKYFEINGSKEFLTIDFDSGLLSVKYIDNQLIPLLQGIEVTILKRGELYRFRALSIEPEVKKLQNFIESEEFEHYYEDVKYRLKHHFFVFSTIFSTKSNQLRAFSFHPEEIKVTYFNIQNGEVKREVSLFTRKPFRIDLLGFQREFLELT